MVLITQSGPTTLAIGSPAPSFQDVPGTDGKMYSLEVFQQAKAVVISFTCNHCPYAQAYEDRFVQLAHDFMPKGVAFLAINPNDVQHYPNDDMLHMKQRAKTKQYPFPYVRDDSQQVARAYGAVCTPHLFVLNDKRQIAYEGRIDDNWKQPEAVTSKDLHNALEDLLASRPVQTPNTNPLGCSIKWKDLR